ncbi:hypothetical protein OAQ73_00500 [Candidatus Pelagibacter sp.]|jgi:hypothetical protein|nr:hypothetical protein [Candidatus Pelagibacter sp.]
MRIRKIFILMLSLCFGYQPLIAETETQITLKVMYEKCADQSFKNQYGSKYIDYLNKPLKVKLANSTPYEWFYEDCEAENSRHPIKFKVKNSIYNNELDNITAKIFEVCANQKYIDNNGDIYSEFLSKSINIKMLQDVEYDWMVEGCEDEYQNYPIKFKLKYS